MAYSHGALEDILDLGEDFELVSTSGGIAGFQVSNYVGRNRHGDQIAATNQQRDKRTDVTLTFRAVKPAGASATIQLGGVGGSSWVATRVTVRQNNSEDAVLEVALHKNDSNSNLHLVGGVAVVTPVCGYGVIAAPLTNLLTDNLIRMDWSAGMDHVDRTGRLGDHLVGVSFGCRLECTQEYIDDGADLTPNTGWHIDSDVPSEENQNVRTRVVSGHSFLPVART